MPKLSLLVPSRNEAFLAQTCADALAHSGPETEVLAVIDGPSPHAAPEPHPRLRVIELAESIGQRAAQNLAARNSTALYVMKVDAHCAFDDGFDAKMMALMQPDITMVPQMRNLHVFDWVCDFCGVREYQGPRPAECKECKSPGDQFTQEVVWKPKTNPTSSAYRFTKELRFKYFPELREIQARGGLQETMSLQGSCFMATRENYFDKELCDESWGSWGQQGSEVALKTWLSGGRVMCNMDTWYAHLFRTQPGFGHPFPNPGASQEKARAVCRDIFLNDRWPKQVYPLAWLLEKFWQPLSRVRPNNKDESDADLWKPADLERLRARPFVIPATGQRYQAPLTRAIIFYTDNELDETIARPVREQLDSISREYDLPITSASLRKMSFGRRNIRFPSLKRSNYAMVKQIIGALENTPADVIYFCEHDVLYHPSHFDFVPTDPNLFYYNSNVWQWKWPAGPAVYWKCRKLSQMVCYRDLALAHYRRRLARLEANNREYDARMGHEPGTRGTRAGGIDDSLCADFRSATCNVDIRHAKNFSKSKWSPADFRDPANCIDWQEADSVPGWAHLLPQVTP
jgi:hypothetical protein